MEDAAAQGLATVDGEVLTLAADDQTVVAEGGKRKSYVSPLSAAHCVAHMRIL